MTNLVVIGVAVLLITNRVERIHPPGTNMTAYHTVARSAWVTCNWDGQVIVMSTNVPILRYPRRYRLKTEWEEMSNAEVNPPLPP